MAELLAGRGGGGAVLWSERRGREWERERKRDTRVFSPFFSLMVTIAGKSFHNLFLPIMILSQSSSLRNLLFRKSFTFHA